MNKYEKLRDSLICGKNDSIDNSAFAVINAVVTGADDAEITEAVKELGEALMPNGQELPVAPETEDIELVEGAISLKEVTEAMKRIISKWGIPKPEEGEDVEWDMQYIADVSDIMQSELDKKNIPNCHPFFCANEDVAEDDENYDEDNDGILCCLSCNRCTNCPEKSEKEEG